MADQNRIDLGELASKVMADTDLMNKLKDFDLDDLAGLKDLLEAHGINVSQEQLSELASTASGLLGKVDLGDLSNMLKGMGGSDGLALGAIGGMMGGLFGRK